jgi:carbon monoxide dehydrogenase subunit G
MHIHRRIEVDCRPEQLWRCLTDAALLKQWVSNLVEETPDDPKRNGLGALSTIQMREGTKVVAYRSVVTAWDPERRLAIRLSGGSFAKGMAMDVLYALSQPTEVRTVLDYDVTVRLKGLFFTLLGPIIFLASASSTRKDLAKLKALADSFKG